MGDLDDKLQFGEIVDSRIQGPACMENVTWTGISDGADKGDASVVRGRGVREGSSYCVISKGRVHEETNDVDGGWVLDGHDSTTGSRKGLGRDGECAYPLSPNCSKLYWISEPGIRMPKGGSEPELSY